MSVIIGIDLGTTNCCVAVMEGKKPKVIPNKQGYNTTPSVLAITDDGSRVVGQVAVRQAITNPQHTVYGAKRLIGREFGSDEVRHASAHSSYEVMEGPHGDVRIKLRDDEHSIPELSAMFLQEMRLVAEDFLGTRVERAVVTVPAYFNDNQRQAVRDAGRIAGLDVVRILNEPTSAALAYGFGTSEPRTLAVYDLGGGTFDISVVRIDEFGDFHVVATTGDSYLGGEDFDERVMDALMQAFERDHGTSLGDKPLAIARVRHAAQKAKVELTDLAEVDINLPFLAQNDEGPIHLDYTFTREQLVSLTGDLITRTLQICEIGLQYADLAPTDIDEVLLVGGMTRMPAIQTAVADYFERPPCKGVHPDEVVALGAAIAGHVIAGEEEGAPSVQMHDVTAHSLGIMTAGGGFDPIIAANTTVPTRKTEVFGTSRDRQTTVKIVILQGESDRAAANDVLGRFALSGLRDAGAGEVEIDVTFTIDVDGIFSVAARDIETGEEKSIEVLASSGLSEDEIKEMMADSAEYLASRRAEEELEAGRQACQVLLDAIHAALPTAERELAWTPVGTKAIDKARSAVQVVEGSLRTADVTMLERHKKLLERVKGMVDRIIDNSTQ